MASSKSVIVVGAGVIGLCTAFYLMRKGHRVTILERGGRDHDFCSLGNAGYISPSHIIPLASPGMPMLGLKMLLKPDSPFHIQPRLSWDLIRWAWKFYLASNPGHVDRSAPLLRDLNMASRRLYLDFAREFGNEFGLEEKGMLLLCKTEHALEDEKKLAKRAQSLGMSADFLSPEETERLEPNIRMDIRGAVYFPDDCHLSPRTFIAQLTRHLEESGVHFRWNSEVTGWQTSNLGIESVSCSSGDYSADEYIIAGGAWSSKIARQLGVSLPMQAGKGYSFKLPSPKWRPSVSAIFIEARVAVTPMGSSVQFGGTMDITGLDQAMRIDPLRVNAIRKAIPLYYPDYKASDFDGLPSWTGMRPCSPDGLPYVGRIKKHANLSVGAGHAMLGMSLGPITGKILAETISEETTEIHSELLRPERYG